jgi:hypothetical protein
VIACVALAVALGGIGYAAVILPKNSVGTKQLKNASVTPEKLARGPAVNVFRTQPQSIPDDISTVIDWTNQAYDRGGMWKPAQPTSVAVRRSGVYSVSAVVVWSASSGNRTVIVTRNGVAIAYDSTTGLGYSTAAAVARFKKGDRIAVRAYQTTGSTVPLFNCPGGACPSLTVAWVGP